MSEKVNVITGAASGIGKSCCEKLLEQGNRVIGLDLNDGTISSGAYRHFTVDVTNEKEIADCIETVFSEYGRIDGLVNAAGIFAKGKPFYELELSEWEKILSVNLTGTFLASKYAAQKMIPAKTGKIVNISCIRSTIYKSNMADYAASKGGVSSLTSAMALDLAQHGIQVNAVAPGFIYTGMTKNTFDNPDFKKMAEGLIPNGKLGMPEDISKVVLFLLSDQSDYVTGTTIYADGGYRLQK